VAREAREQARWTCESRERREPTASGGKTAGIAISPCAVLEGKFCIPRSEMAVPEGLHQFKQINNLRWLTEKSGPNTFQ
jgi:hypothetical protein